MLFLDGLLLDVMFNVIYIYIYIYFCGTINTKIIINDEHLFIKIGDAFGKSCYDNLFYLFYFYMLVLFFIHYKILKLYIAIILFFY